MSSALPAPSTTTGLPDSDLDTLRLVRFEVDVVHREVWTQGWGRGCVMTATDRLVVAVMVRSGMKREQIIEAGRYGADMGWSGFIYNTEATAFFDQHAELVWEHLAQLADDLGEPNSAASIASFQRADMMHS